MHQRERAALITNCIEQRGAHQALGAFLRDRLDAQPGGVGEADLGVFLGELGFEQRLELSIVGRALLELDAGINVFRVLAEDDHIHILRALDR